MRLEPLQNWVNGRVAVTRASQSIILLDPTVRITRYTLIEQVSPQAEAAGFHVGDFVVVKAMWDMFFNAGGGKGKTIHLVTFPITEVINRVHDLDVNELVKLDGTPFEVKVEIAA